MKSVRDRIREVKVGVLSITTLPQFCEARNDILDVDDFVYRRIGIQVRDTVRMDVNDLTKSRRNTA